MLRLDCAKEPSPGLKAVRTVAASLRRIQPKQVAAGRDGKTRRRFAAGAGGDGGGSCAAERVRRGCRKGALGSRSPGEALLSAHRTDCGSNCLDPPLELDVLRGGSGRGGRGDGGGNGSDLELERRQLAGNRVNCCVRRFLLAGQQGGVSPGLNEKILESPVDTFRYGFRIGGVGGGGGSKQALHQMHFQLARIGVIRLRRQIHRMHSALLRPSVKDRNRKWAIRGAAIISRSGDRAGSMAGR